MASPTRLRFPDEGVAAIRLEAFGKSLVEFVDRRAPEKSLLLLKPTNRIPHKGGERTPLADVVPYSAPITRKGLTVMETPGLDVESVTGMVGGGAQVVVFTTGLGTPTGNPIAPVIKITGNARTAASMADNLDLDVSGVLDDRETLDMAAARLFDEVLAVCSGRETATERLGFREFAIHRRNPTI